MAVLNQQIRKLFAVLVMFLCAAAFAQEDKLPKIALYISNSTLKSSERSLLTRKFLAPFTASGLYNMIDRSDVFTQQATLERIKQRDGSVRDDEIRKIGYEYGAEYICVVELDYAFGRWNIGARMVNVVGGGVYLAQGETDIVGNLNTADLSGAAKTVFDQIHRKSSAQKTPITYTINAAVNPVNGGYVTRNPDQTYYESGTNVSITAVPANGYAFTGWSGDNSSTKATLTAPIDRDLTLTANFQYIQRTYTLTTNVSPSGSGLIARNPPKQIYIANEAVTVTAIADNGYSFIDWSGAASGRTNRATVIMDGNKTVTANFYRQSVSVPAYQTPMYQQSSVIRAGTVTDSRDGKRYKTVTIGGVTWMAENLNYDNGNSWCYGKNKYNCDKYGMLYDWNTAKAVCPYGWHLPSRQEWNNLVTAVGSPAGTKLKSRSGWNNNGTDDFGFSALPGSYRGSDGSFSGAGNYGYWWTATEDGSDYAYYRYMYYYIDYVREDGYDKSYGRSVRCVKDVR
jgi:uncharacterized protein (TIGR02145 family)/uncharacterized repeat protein (TIGR02543 family)